MINNKDILGNDESVFIKYQSFPPGMMGLMVSGDNYYINIRITTIVVAALILDLYITRGAMATILGMCGVPKTSIVKINETTGEKCILKETLMRKSKRGDQNILSSFNGKCCNNNMNCQYRDGDNCTCKRENVLAIFQKLTDKNIFKANGDFYDYQW